MLATFKDWNFYFTIIGTSLGKERSIHKLYIPTNITNGQRAVMKLMHF